MWAGAEAIQKPCIPPGECVMTIAFDFVLKIEKNGKVREVRGNKLRKFRDTAKDGTPMSHREFLSPEFSDNEFYPIISTVSATA